MLLFNDSTTTNAMGRLVDFDAAHLIEPPAPLAEGDVLGFGLDHDGSTIVGRALSSEVSTQRAFKHVGSSWLVFAMPQPYANTAVYTAAYGVRADGSAVVGACRACLPSTAAARSRVSRFHSIPRR